MNIERFTSFESIWDAYHTRMVNGRDEEAVINGAASEQGVSSQVEQTIHKANTLLEPSQVHLKFELHEKLDEYYVKVVDSKTEAVIREIPPKQWLDFYAAMAEFIGLLVDKSM
ncbi:flagellar protein FlaG [Bacillus atrophaeus]|uniref:flagellar protein FlaG n=1 Tax=Bacillus atrophaeus TaxID=1452 RepID=UPI001EFA9A59|nr:flagellar protein FlaG [Bacillus atrophaeus]MCG8398448.1 flagellar protein FlaG [Bacillus atrophaeus]